MSVIMTMKTLLLTILIGITTNAISFADRIADPLPEGIPNGYYWISTLWLNDVDGDTLRHKYYQVIVVNEKPDPISATGELIDDSLDSLSMTFYNSPEAQLNYNTHVPGMIDLQFTVRDQDINPSDRTVQYGEQVMVRIYNGDTPEQATHCRETEIWESVPGLHKWYSEEDLFGDWIPIEK
jgi:hypothetical protein